MISSKTFLMAVALALGMVFIISCGSAKQVRTGIRRMFLELNYVKKGLLLIFKVILFTGIIAGIQCADKNHGKNINDLKPKHVDKSNPLHQYTNHLIGEKSPYLLQHAHNPVNWYPWGQEAFDKARKENKPIFLSVGYSTCHWCHVMEKESFSKPEIADIMNKYFISIKVDREERPDIDKLYMAAAQAAGWGGGWPLSMWLTPELKPFYGGTYFPPKGQWGRPGFSEILLSIAEEWSESDKKTGARGALIIQHLKQYEAAQKGKGSLSPVLIENGFQSYSRRFEPSYGGFGRSPKFPMPVNHNFLLRNYRRFNNKEALRISLHTLYGMAKGGIRDQIGGGFHRYSTDIRWHIPHFEKMLYDNAQITVNYLEAYQITREESFAQIARETLEYVLRDMTYTEGGFFSAEDADSLPPELFGKVSGETHEYKSEGAFYLWRKQEILEILGKESEEIFSYYYGVKRKGNARSDPHSEFTGKNILFVAHTIHEVAKKFSKTESEIKTILKDSREKLLKKRAERPRPGLDDKILVSWNGLMISAFARASQVLEEPRYLEAAEKAARFMQSKLYDQTEKKLYRRWRDGDRSVFGIAEDYAFLVQGLIDLYEASFNIKWLNWAIELAEIQNELFYDKENGGFFMTAVDHDKNLLIRMKTDYDNVEPAASSVVSLNLLRLAQYSSRKDFYEIAETTLSSFGKRMKQQPASLPQMLVALDYYLSKPQQIIILGDPDRSDTQAMLKAVHQRFIPNKILIVLDSAGSQKAMGNYMPFVKEITRIEGKATAYICINYACSLPTNDIKVLRQILDGGKNE